MIIIADSGSTSVDWRLIKDDASVLSYRSEGVNPVFQDSDDILRIFKDAAGHLLKSSLQICSIYYYGAGILSGATSDKVKMTLSRAFDCRNIVTESDLLAASRALFGHSAGIAAILGTGSNSALYDGERIVRNIKAGGFILGDEGSGAVLGKNLISDYIKGLLPQDLQKDLEDEYSLSYPVIVEKVYRGNMPSRYLASFSIFMKEHESHPYIKTMLENNFKAFFERNILSYGKNKLPIGFIGSVSLAFEDVIREAASGYGFTISGFEKNAGDGLVDYHLSEMNCQ